MNSLGTLSSPFLSRTLPRTVLRPSVQGASRLSSLAPSNQHLKDSNFPDPDNLLITRSPTRKQQSEPMRFTQQNITPQSLPYLIHIDETHAVASSSPQQSRMLNCSSGIFVSLPRSPFSQPMIYLPAKRVSKPKKNTSGKLSPLSLTRTSSQSQKRMKNNKINKSLPDFNTPSMQNSSHYSISLSKTTKSSNEDNIKIRNQNTKNKEFLAHKTPLDKTLFSHIPDSTGKTITRNNYTTLQHNTHSDNRNEYHNSNIRNNKKNSRGSAVITNCSREIHNTKASPLLKDIHHIQSHSEATQVSLSPLREWEQSSREAQSETNTTQQKEEEDASESNAEDIPTHTERNCTPRSVRKEFSYVPSNREEQLSTVGKRAAQQLSAEERKTRFVRQLGRRSGRPTVLNGMRSYSHFSDSDSPSGSEEEDESSEWLRSSESSASSSSSVLNPYCLPLSEVVFAEEPSDNTTSHTHRQPQSRIIDFCRLLCREEEERRSYTQREITSSEERETSDKHTEEEYDAAYESEYIEVSSRHTHKRETNKYLMIHS